MRQLNQTHFHEYRRSSWCEIGELGILGGDGPAASNKLLEARNCLKIVPITANGPHSRQKAILHSIRVVFYKYLNRSFLLFKAQEQAKISVIRPGMDSICQLIPQIYTVGHFPKDNPGILSMKSRLFNLYVLE